MSLNETMKNLTEWIRMVSNKNATNSPDIVNSK